MKTAMDEEAGGFRADLASLVGDDKLAKGKVRMKFKKYTQVTRSWNGEKNGEIWKQLRFVRAEKNLYNLILIVHRSSFAFTTTRFHKIL